jgi:hypothetical protein
MLFGLVPKSRCLNAVEMTYITTRNNRFYVVTYDGVDPATGKERRRWHAATVIVGSCRRWQTIVPAHDHNLSRRSRLL